MAYEKQTWIPYDDNKTEEQNIQDGAVVTAERINHLETGLDEHDKNTTNPHKVTKAQVGLGNVTNVEQAPKTDLTSHTSNKTNPHGVTKSQVGLGNVSNVEQASKTVFDSHVADKTNPHSVTKAQVDLGNVNNYATANQTDAEQGLAGNKFMTPMGVKQHVDKRIATQAEVNAGMSDSSIITPKTLKGYFNMDISDWTTLTLNSGVIAADNSTPQYRVTTYAIGGTEKKRIEFRGAVTGASGTLPSASTQVIISNLTTTLRPKQTEMAPAQTNKISTQGRCAVTTAGNFYVGQDSGSTVDYIYISGFGYWLD